MRITIFHVAAILSALHLACAPTFARPDNGAPLTVQAADSIPPVPDVIAGQRANYGSPNLLPGDTSFELPSGDYIYGISPSGVPFSEASLSPLRPNCTSTLSVHGNHALRVSRLQPNGNHVLYWPAVSLAAGHSYTFSAYLRSSSPDAIIHLICPPFLTEARTPTVRTKEQWQRHWVTFSVPEEEGRPSSPSCLPAIVVSAAPPLQGTPVSPEWRVELDAVQIEDAASPSPYRPHQAIDYAAILPRTLPFDHALAGQPLRLHCASRNNSSVVLRLQLIWQLTDALSRSDRIRTVETTLQPGRRFSTEPDFGPVPQGYYLLKTYVRGGLDAGHVDQRDLSVLNPPPENGPASPPFFGRINPMGSLDVRPAVRPSVFEKLTARWPRVCAASWASVEFAPGQYDIAALTTSVGRVRSNNAIPVVCLSDGGPWPPAQPTSGVASRQTFDPSAVPNWSVLHNGQTPAVDPRQYRQFVYRAVLQMSPRVGHWIAPEPATGSPTDLHIEFVRAARLADPNACIIHRTLKTEALNTVSRPSLTTGSSTLSDVLLHTTWTPGPDDPVSDAQGLDRRLATLAQDNAGKRVPLARWEATPLRHWPRAKDPATRATAIHRMALLLKKNGVTQWLIPDPPPECSPLQLGPPIEVTTLACMVDWLAPAQFRRDVSPNASLFLLEYEYTLGRFAAVMLRNPGKNSHAASLLIPAGIRVTNLFAAPLTDGSEATNIEPAITPVYLWPIQQQDGWLDELVQRNRPQTSG